jgi:hypothetical protein
VDDLDPTDPRPRPVRPAAAWRPDPKPPRRRWRAFRWLLGLVLLGGVFVLGYSVGKAIEDTPDPGGTQTLVRTLAPETIGPVRVVTVRPG